MRGVAMLVRSLEDPNVPISSASIADLFPTGRRTLSGARVSEQRVFGVAAWYRGVALMAGTMAGLPLKTYKNGSRERVQQRTVLDSPNPAQTPFEFWQTIYAHALSWGTAYGLKERDGSDIVRRVWPIHPMRVGVEHVKPTSSNPAGKVFDVTNPDGTTVRVTPWEMMQLPYLSLDGRVGIAPLTFARETLGITISAEESAAKFYGSGTRLSGILSSKQKLQEVQADRLKARWHAKVSGPDNAGDIAVLDADTTFQPISMPPQDAQLLESRKFGVVEIARLLGIPPHLLGDVERSTSWGTGIEQQVLGFVKFTLKPWLDLIEQRVTRELLPGGWERGSWFAEYSLEGLLRGDAAARAAFYHSGIVDGWLRRSEARNIENLTPAAPEEGLDRFMAPSNLTLVQVNGEMVPLSAAGTANTDTTSEPVDEGEA